MFRPHSWYRTLVRAVIVTVGLVGVAAVSLPSAAADLGGLTCVSDTEVRYSPGLMVTPREVNIQVNGELACVPLASDITAGTYGAHLMAVRSCADLTNPTTGVFTINWNGGTHGFSTISFTRTATIVGGNIVTTEVGTVVAGDFTGHPTLFETVGPHNPLDCFDSNGVQLVHTNGNLTIAPLP